MLAIEDQSTDSWESDSVAPMTDAFALGDDLAILSLRVAQELDRKRKDQAINPQVFSEFRKELSRASGIGEADVTAFLHSDPAIAEVFAQAVRETSAESIQDIGALNAAVLKIIEPLAKAGKEFPDDQIETVKTFCLSLHRSMMAQKLPPLHEGERSFEDELRFVR
jgi:hypothetical protein